MESLLEKSVRKELTVTQENVLQLFSEEIIHDYKEIGKSILPQKPISESESDKLLKTLNDFTDYINKHLSEKKVNKKNKAIVNILSVISPNKLKISYLDRLKNKQELKDALTLKNVQGFIRHALIPDITNYLIDLQEKKKRAETVLNEPTKIVNDYDETLKGMREKIKIYEEKIGIKKTNPETHEILIDYKKLYLDILGEVKYLVEHEAEDASKELMNIQADFEFFNNFSNVATQLMTNLEYKLSNGERVIRRQIREKAGELVFGLYHLDETTNISEQPENKQTFYKLQALNEILTE